MQCLTGRPLDQRLSPPLGPACQNKTNDQHHSARHVTGLLGRLDRELDGVDPLGQLLAALLREPRGGRLLGDAAARHVLALLDRAVARRPVGRVVGPVEREDEHAPLVLLAARLLELDGVDLERGAGG